MGNIHESVAKALSKKYDIEVIFQGTTAMTNGKQIIIPAMPEDALKDPDTLSLIRGYIDHEVGHVRFTDFSVSERYQLSGRIHAMTNQLEDFRIEKAMASAYAGSKVNLERLANLVATKSNMTFQSPIAKLWAEGRRQMGFNIDGPSYHADCVEAFGSDIFDRIAALQSTEDSIKLACKLLGVEMQEGEGQGQEQGEGEGQKEGDQGQGGQDGRHNGGHYDGSDLDNWRPDAVIPSLLQEAQKEALGNKKYIPFSTKDDILCQPFDPNRPFYGGATYNTPVDEYCKIYDMLLKELGPLNVMRARFAAMFKTDTKKAWLQGRESGKLNARALASVATGNTRVFKEQYQKRDIDTAVTILIDWSGSMSGKIFLKQGVMLKKIRLAMQSAVMLTELLTNIGIKHEIIAFTTFDAANYVPGFARTDPIIMPLLKGFDETIKSQQIRARFGGYTRAYKGANADGESLQIAYSRLKVRPEKRKIMIVLSDGDINIMGDKGIYKAHFKAVAKAISKEIELLGIGFVSSFVRNYYPNHVVVTNEEAARLPEFMFDTIKSFLMDDKKR